MFAKPLRPYRLRSRPGFNTISTRGHPVLRSGNAVAMNAVSRTLHRRKHDCNPTVTIPTYIATSIPSVRSAPVSGEEKFTLKGRQPCLPGFSRIRRRVGGAVFPAPGNAFPGSRPPCTSDACQSPDTFAVTIPYVPPRVAAASLAPGPGPPYLPNPHPP